MTGKLKTKGKCLLQEALQRNVKCLWLFPWPCNPFCSSNSIRWECASLDHPESTPHYIHTDFWGKTPIDASCSLLWTGKGWENQKLACSLYCLVFKTRFQNQKRNTAIWIFFFLISVACKPLKRVSCHKNYVQNAMPLCKLGRFQYTHMKTWAATLQNGIRQRIAGTYVKVF